MKKITMALAAAGIALSCISMGVQAADGTAEYSAVGVPPVRQGVPFVRRGVPLAIFR